MPDQQLSLQSRLSLLIFGRWSDLNGSSHYPTVTTALPRFCDDTDLVTNLVTNKKALVSEGFDDKQVLDLVGCGGWVMRGKLSLCMHTGLRRFPQG